MDMSGVMSVLIVVAMVATAAVLMVGVMSMLVGGRFNQKYSNKLMQWRVGLQGLAIVLVLLFLLMSGR
ncbi:twin transmembrane helix small protein [Tistrella bauzanensis]|jgi:biopolymer transport protein ExbB/TolQ|uniref:Twin transmembrane helix small protein n=2 Tax=Tistrella TaxID=171436 RepID=A0ABU9YG43_9PROT|nr:twin transmembrane helix small protein [Tistrella bauzanensis]